MFRTGRVYSLILHIRGCSTGQGMVFTSLLTGYIVSRQSVLNRVYNFVRVCPYHYPPVENIVIS